MLASSPTYELQSYTESEYNCRLPYGEPATVKDVPINNDVPLNIQACLIQVWEKGICSPIW